TVENFDGPDFVRWGNEEDGEYNDGTYGGSLAPGDWAEFEATYEVTQTDIDNGFLGNRAVVTSEAPDKSEVRATSEGSSPGELEDCPNCTVTELPASAGIKLEKTSEVD